MRRTLLTFICFCAFCRLSVGQQCGFFKRFPSGERWLVPSCAIETDDGNFIVAINDDSFEGNGELAKLSSEGELLLTNPFNAPDHWSRAYNIFRHPQEQGNFIGLGTDIEPPFDVWNGIPYFFLFDEELNLTFQTYPEWPEELRNYWLSPTCLLGRDRKIFCEYFLMNHDRLFHFRRIRTRMSLNGDFERFIEDTTDTHPSGSNVGTIFEYAGTKELGMYRMSRVMDSLGIEFNTLFRVNENLECEPVNKLYRFGEDTIITNSYVDFRAIFLTAADSRSTIIPLDETTLLFSTAADESLYRYAYVTDTIIFDLQHSAVMFKADTAGNIGQFCVIGSWNDTIEQLPNRSIDITNPNITGNREIYHCCYSERVTYLDESPNTLTVTKFTEDFDILWRKSYSLYNTYLKATHLMTTSDGGCLIIGEVMDDGNHEWFALKLTPDGTTGTSEITVTDDVFFYPNPVKDILYIHYPEETHPQAIALYDMQGHLVLSQNNSLGSLSMTGLASGQYVLKVTLADGKVFSNKVIKE